MWCGTAIPITSEQCIWEEAASGSEMPPGHERRPGQHFASRILPPYMRRSPRLTEVLPILSLRGLSTGDFSGVLEVLLGPEAAGFSATTITRLLRVWQEEYQVWRNR